MAVSIDKVYQRVLAIANKEQRGYITPQEFNIFANQAQMNIFEQYFYDQNQFSRVNGNDTEYSDMLNILEEKINIFEVFRRSLALSSSQSFTSTADQTDFTLVASNFGGVNPASITDITVYVNNVQVTPVSYNGTVVVLAAQAVGNIVKVVANNSLISIPNKAYRLGSIEYYDGSKYVEVENIRAKDLRDILNSPLLAPSSSRPVYVRKKDNINIYPSHIVSQLYCNYVKKPKTANWAYNVVLGKALYNSSNSVDFELHDSEETSLVLSILKLAGISMQKQDVTAIAQAGEDRKVQQEKS